MSGPALVLEARRLRAARGVVVARDVSLTAAAGDVVAVEGPNGSGKATLLAAAAGLLPAGKASVRPGSVGYAPERAGVLPRPVRHQAHAADAAAAAEHQPRDHPYLDGRPGGLAVRSRRGPGRAGLPGRYSPDLTQV
ncbi:MAG: ATP-binding cassette domain-containing protein [Streptosporangiaceae bacterium]